MYSFMLHPRRMLERSRANRGFSLIEVMIAIFVLTIGILAILGLFPSFFKMRQQSWGRIQAIALAQQKMADMKSGTYGNPMPTACGGYTDIPVNGFTRSWCAKPALVQPDLQAVWVRVNWIENGNPEQIQLDSYMSF